MLPECPPHDFGPPIEVTDGVMPQFPPEPDPVLLGVLETYGRDHPEAWAGLWLTPNDGRDNVVIAVVGDVDAHREAILERRPTPDDVTVIHPPPTSTDTTTVAETAFEIDVVPATRTLAELEALQEQLRGSIVAGETPVDVISYSVDVTTNRIRIGITEMNDANRLALAHLIDPDAACVEQMDPIRWPPGEPPPSSFSPHGDFPEIGSSVD